MGVPVDSGGRVAHTSGMRPRTIAEIEDPPGRWPVSKWIDENLDKAGRAKLHARLNRIETDETENPNWIKHYTSLSMREIRFDYGGRAIRILCEQQGTRLIMLVATAKDGQIASAEEQRAMRRQRDFRQGKANVREFELPQRPSSDMGRVR